MTHTVETRIKLSIHRYASRLSTLEIEGTADKNLFSFRKLFAAHLKTSYLKYALMLTSLKKIIFNVSRVLYARGQDNKISVLVNLSKQCDPK